MSQTNYEKLIDIAEAALFVVGAVAMIVVAGTVL